MTSNNNELYEQVRNSADIADIIGERVRLRKTGRGFMGLCPFHSERTPSFHVYTDTQSYYCFACHEGGNVFTYLMKTEGLSFREALEFLAGRAGIKLPEYKKHNTGSVQEILEMSAKFFAENLSAVQGTAARAYMKRRNIEASDAMRFTLGYSLNSWDSLVNYLRKTGISPRQILESGLALENRNGLYDRFRGRLMFAIRDISGKIIAFGGRLIDGEGAKYINSPENEIYSKRKNLYLLNEARKAIREKNRSVLVEGYMDALRLHKCGYNEAVASLGTSLTEEQAKLLSRFSDRCYICYDSDKAGQNAIIKGMYILQENGLDVYVVNLPEGKDPDEFLCSNSPESFEILLQNAKPLVLHYINYMKPSLNNPGTRKHAVKELFENLSRLEKYEVSQYTAQLSEAANINPSEIDEMLKNPVYASQIQEEEKKLNANNNDFLEAAMCAMMYKFPEFRIKLEPMEAMKLLHNELSQETALAIMTENIDELELLWLTMGETEKISFLQRGEELCGEMKKLSNNEKWEKIINGLKREKIERRIAEIKTLPADKQDIKEIAELYKARMLYNK